MAMMTMMTKIMITMAMTMTMIMTVMTMIKFRNTVSSGEQCSRRLLKYNEYRQYVRTSCLSINIILSRRLLFVAKVVQINSLFALMANILSSSCVCAMSAILDTTCIKRPPAGHSIISPQLWKKLARTSL